MALKDTKTALITGATSGIGYELSKLFAHDGYDLVINARHEEDLVRVADELERASGSSVVVISKDLSERSAPDEIFSYLRERSIEIDALVNNAGFGLQGPFAETNLETELAMMEVNMVALTQLTKLVLGGMLERGSGRILNVASTASFLPGPLMAIYYATKAYVLSFSQAIASELEGSGVSVTVLCPGPTDTSFQDRAGQTSTWLLHLMAQMEPERVARAGYQGMMEGQRIVFPGFRDRLTAFFQRFAPRAPLADGVRELHKRRSD